MLQSLMLNIKMEKIINGMVIRKIKPHTKKLEKLADNLARTWVFIHPCRECHYPVIDGFCCPTCGSNSPRCDLYE